jgi:hypothetical protein
MFEENERITAAVDRVWEYLLMRSRGVMIPWAVIDALTGMDHRIHPGARVINRIKARLMAERQIIADVDVGVGLRLLTSPQALLRMPHKRQKRAYRQINRCIREVELVEPSDLSLVERRSLAMQRANLRGQRLAIGRSKRELLKAVQPTATNPRRKDP